MKGRQLVSQPGDGVGLAATCRVLNEVVMPQAVLSGMGYQAAHRIQLVVTGKISWRRPVLRPRSSSSSTSWIKCCTRLRTLSLAQTSCQR